MHLPKVIFPVNGRSGLPPYSLVLGSILFFWLRQVLAAAHEVSVAAHKPLSSRGLRALQHVGSVVPQHVESVPRSGIKPTSPALQGRFLTAGPPGESPGVPALDGSCPVSPSQCSGQPPFLGNSDSFPSLPPVN